MCICMWCAYMSVCTFTGLWEDVHAHNEHALQRLKISFLHSRLYYLRQHGSVECTLTNKARMANYPAPGSPRFRLTRTGLQVVCLAHLEFKSAPGNEPLTVKWSLKPLGKLSLFLNKNALIYVGVRHEHATCQSLSCYLGSKDHIQVFQFGHKHLYLMSHQTGPFILIVQYWSIGFSAPGINSRTRNNLRRKFLMSC